jgi:hypothetical protein
MITFSQLGQLGRLSNSLFQLVTTITHAKHIGTYAVFKDSWTYRNDFPNLDKVSYIFGKELPYIPKYYKVYKEPSFNYTPIPSEDWLDLEGYFQSSQFFDDYEIDIKNVWLDFSVDIKSKVQEKYKELIEKGFTAIHVRRGDYLNFPQHHPVLPMQYYLDGIEYIYSTRHINWPIVCFSDDIDWCKQHVVATVFVEENRDVEDLYLSTLADNIIIANSSFSWWGSFLNKKDHITVAPKNWFGPAYADHDTKDLYCPNWKIL